MSNELMLVINIVVVYFLTLMSYYLFGKKGVLCWNAIATIAANIEVMILIEAFGMEQTLGNIMFATTFVATDILSENYGKKEAALAVKTGIFVSVAFIIFTRIWLMYTPSANDTVMPSIITVFSNTPRVMLAGFVVYGIVQAADVFLYHKIWKFTEKLSGSAKGFLWLRNNAATLISQFLNAILFNLAAFAGVYDAKTLVSIIISTYVIYIITSLADTPIVYLARKMKQSDKVSVLYR